MASAYEVHLSCSICMNLYEDPRILPCGHSYCEKCIRGLMDSDMNKQILTCPLCMAEHPCSYTKNYELKSLVETYINDQTTSEWKYIHQGKRELNLSQLSTDQENKLFCWDCDKLITVAQIIRHNKHNIKPLSEAHSLFKEPTMSANANCYRGLSIIHQGTIRKLVQIINGRFIVDVTIYTGDVTDLKTDALAVSESANFNSQESLAKHVLKRGGKAYEANKMGLKTTTHGRVKSCAAGSNLACNFVYHVVVPTSIWRFIIWNRKDAELGEVVRTLFETVANDGRRIIALPLLGSGNAAFHPSVCARVLADALCHLTDYEGGNHSLKSVYIVNVSPEMTEVVLQEFESRVTEA